MRKILTVAVTAAILCTGFTGGGFHGGGGSHGPTGPIVPSPKPLTNTTVTTNDTSNIANLNTTTVDVRQPYSDGHLYSTPNSFGSYTTVVLPDVKTLAPGVEMRNGVLFIDGHSSGPCDQAQRAGLPKCW